MATFNTAIAASSDDADQAAGTVDLTGTTLNANATSQYIGLRFLNVTIANAATISAASLNLYFTSTSFDSPNVLIYGEDVDDATTFTTGSNNISGRTLTTANVAWNATDIGTGAKTSPDISSVIQEIVNRAGWASGNDINIIIKGNSAGSLMRIASWDSANPEAQIDITYGSSNFPQAVGGTLTSSGAAVKGTGKKPGGTLTTAGSAVKRTGKPLLAGTLTSAGAAVKRAGKVTAGTLTSSGAAMKATAKGKGVYSRLLGAGDAAHETTGGTVTLSDDESFIGGYPGGPYALAGWIFRDVPIPAGATVLAAEAVDFVPIAADELYDVTLRGEGNPANFAASSNNLSARTKTTAGVIHTGTTTGDPVFAGVDLAPVIQEIIDGSWTAGDDLALYAIDRGDSAFGINGTSFFDPYLYLEWTGPGYLWGALSSSGAAVKNTGKTMAGALTSSGVVIAAKTFLVAVAGALTSAGGLVKATAKNTAGTLTSAGESLKATTKTVGGALSSSGALTAFRTFAVAVAGTLSSAGAVAKSTAKNVAGELTSAGASLKATAKNVTGTLTTEGALTALRQFYLSLAGSLTSAGAVVKATGKTTAGTLTSAGSTVKNTAKTLAGSLSSSGALATVRAFVVNLAGTLTSAGAVAKATTKSMAGTLTTAGVAAKTTAKTLAGSLSSAGGLVKATAKNLAGTLTTSGALSRIAAYAVAVGGTLTTAGGVVKSTAKSLTGVLDSAGAVVKGTAKNVAGTLDTAGGVLKATAKRLAGALSTSGALSAVTQVVIALTARARDFALTVQERDFSLTAQARAFSMTVQARAFALLARARDFSLTAKGRK